MKCPKCGYENPESAKHLTYCSMCYEPFQKTIPQQQSPTTTDSINMPIKNMPASGNPMFSRNMYDQPPTQQFSNIASGTGSIFQESKPVQPQKNILSYLPYIIIGLISLFFITVGPKKMIRSVLVMFDNSAHSQKDFRDELNGIKLECPSDWVWVLLTSEAEMINAYDLQSMANMGAKPICAVRNKLYDSHLVFINFPKHLFGGQVPVMTDAFSRFSGGMAQTPGMKDFKYTSDETATIDYQAYLKKSFTTQYQGVAIEGFVGMIERKDSFIILLSMFEKSSSEPVKEALESVKKSIKLDATKNSTPFLGF